MVTAITMVKDEADVIDQTIGHMLTQVDAVIALDNGSTDGTLEFLQASSASVVLDPSPGYYQSAKMTRLAGLALRKGADWVVPFDADEIWLAVEGTVAETLEALPDEALIADALLFDHVATPNGGVGPPMRRMPFRRKAPAALRKVACRALASLTIHQGNHSAEFRNHPLPLTVTGQLEVRHFPYRSPDQFIRKVRNGAAAYAATELPPDIGAHWRAYGKLTDDELREVFDRYFFRASPDSPVTIGDELQPPLIFDPCPLKF